MAKLSIIITKMSILFDIEEETTKEIYKLYGKGILGIFVKNKYVLLVLAKNVREALANNKDFTYVTGRTLKRSY